MSDTRTPCEIIDARIDEVKALHRDSGGSRTDLGAYWEGYREGLLYAQREYKSALAEGARAAQQTQKPPVAERAPYWCYVCKSWRHTHPCGRDECPPGLAPEPSPHD